MAASPLLIAIMIDIPLRDFQLPFARQLEERSQAYVSKQYEKIISCLKRLCIVFAIPENVGGDVYQQFMTWTANAQHNTVRDMMGAVFEQLANGMLDAFAGVTRLCVGATVSLTYRSTAMSRTTYLRVLNQEPLLGSYTTQNQLWLCTDRFFSDRVDLRSTRWIPPYNPARRAWHPEEEAWRYKDGAITDEAAAAVSH